MPLMKRIVWTAVAVCGLLVGAVAFAAPTGEQVVMGDVTFNQDGSVTVIQASDGAIIHYDSFDIFAGEVVQFIQPGEHARVLNRVFGDATRIDGTLLANGIVYIVNPAGIFLDGNAVLEVGGLVAAAGHISDDDFLGSVDRFELTGPVVNASDSLHGEQLALLGRRVENLGSITAPDGTIALVAGERVVLARLGGRVMVEVDGPVGAAPDTGVLQAGLVEAGGGQVIFAVGDHYSLAINHEGVTRGGDVELRGGEEGVLLVSGEIDASDDQTGGSIRVLGDRIALLGGRLDVSGGQAGGSIRVGGDVRGEGELPTARRTYVDGESELLADATGSGDGGSIVVWGDEAAVVSGRLSARGGAQAGDGGFAEISSLGLLDVDASVDLSAPAGSSGSLLFDPQDIVITAGTADGSDVVDMQDDQLLQDPNPLGQVLFGDIGADDPFVIYESEIESTDASILLEARNGIGVSGAFVGGVVVTDGNSLTMRTQNAVDDDLNATLPAGIDLGNVEWHTSGGGSIDFVTGTSGDESGVAAGITVGNLVTDGGAIDLLTFNGSIVAGDIDTSGADGDTGAAAGSVELVAGLAGGVTTGAITATGGAGAIGAGGAGGPVTATTRDGSILLASVDASGGDGATDGGSGAGIVLRAEDLDGSGGNVIDVGGDLTSRGGEGPGGSGGAGGRIDVQTLATPVDPAIDPPLAPAGGGPITIGGSIDTSGGDGDVGGNAARMFLVSELGDVAVDTILATGGAGATDNGGVGGSVTVGSRDGSVTVTSVDASGGDGATNGRNGGRILVRAEDADASGPNTVDVAGDLLSRGGEGFGGNGGTGGDIIVVTAAAPIDPDEDPPPDPTGGGPITIGGDIDTSGGDGTANGGDAGDVTVTAEVSGSIDVGDITARGGDADPAGTGNGGRGGAIFVASDDGDLTAGAADSSGGDAGSADTVDEGRSGDAGDLRLQAGIDGGAGALNLTGTVRAVDGLGAPDDFPDFSGLGVVLSAQDDVEFQGVGGPQISTSEALTLVGSSVGADTPTGTIEVDGGDTVDRALDIRVADTAQVDVTSAGFNLIRMTGTTNDASFDVTQAAEKAGGDGVTIDIDGAPGSNTIVRIDTTQTDGIAGGTDTVGEAVDVSYSLIDFLEGDDDLALSATVASGAVTAGGSVTIGSEDDLVLEDGAIVMNEILDPGAFDADPPPDPLDSGTRVTGDLLLLADLAADESGLPIDGDGTGAVIASGTNAAIDMGADYTDPDDVLQAGRLRILAGSGIGDDLSPIVTQNLGDLLASVSTSGGIHLRNDAGGEMRLARDLALGPNALHVLDGDDDGVLGDIHVVNLAGDLVVAGAVIAADEDIDDSGSVTLSVMDPAAVIRFEDPTVARVEASVDVDFDGPVELRFDAEVVAGGDVGFGDTIDSDAAAMVTRNLVVDAGGATSFEGDVGSGFQLRNLTVVGDTVLSEDRSFRALQTLSFGDVNADSDDAAAMTAAGERVRFSGDVGRAGRLLGLVVDSDTITFDATGEQFVVTGDGGIGLDTGGLAAPSTVANIGKSGGDLELDTEGSLDIGPNQKLTVDGVARLIGATVRVGDVSAHEIHVESADFQLRARESANFFDPTTGTLPDGGPDLVANVITATSAPTVFGAGRAPRFGTLSGVVGDAGSGGFDVITIAAPVTPAALVEGSNPDAPTFFDLGLAIADPGNETEASPLPVTPLLPARPGDRPPGGAAVPPGSTEVQAFLRCTERADRGGSARPCAGAPGSPLDSERGDDIAQRYARLFGDSPEAAAARQLLAGDPDREERDGVLRDVASLLAQLRLLGMGLADYESLRDQLLDTARGETPRDDLLADVRAHGRGLPL
jgi:filamentous hemagglutinin family protein